MTAVLKLMTMILVAQKFCTEDSAGPLQWLQPLHSFLKFPKSHPLPASNLFCYITLIPHTHVFVAAVCAESLASSDVTRRVAIGRRVSGLQHSRHRPPTLLHRRSARPAPASFATDLQSPQTSSQRRRRPTSSCFAALDGARRRPSCRRQVFCSFLNPKRKQSLLTLHPQQWHIHHPQRFISLLACSINKLLT
jgi:hypothetical protein